MPVFSFSRASISAITPLPLFRICRRRSTSWWKPSRMKPPSRTEKGGSSQMASVRRAPMSSRVSSSSVSSARRRSERAESCPRISGSFPMAERREAMSRPPAVP